MNYEQAEQIVKDRVKNTDNACEFNGFDGYSDTSWSGNLCDDDIALDDDTFLFFDGVISFNISESTGEIIDVEIISIESFEHYGSDNETITNFKTN